MRVAGVTAIAAGSGLILVSPASAAPVPDAAALRAAITNLNGTGPAAEIELMPGMTYALPGGDACLDEDDNLSGDLDVRRTQPLTIFTPQGAAPAILRNDCDAATSPQRILDVKAPAGLYGAGKLTLRNIILRNGHAPTGTPNGDGGAVRSVADLVIENSRFENNTAGNGNASTAAGTAGERGGSGGAVATFGSVTIDGSTFTGNAAGPGASGFTTSGLCTEPGASDGGPGGAGGAVFAAGGGTITNSTFSGNRGGSGGPGGSESCVTTGENPTAGTGAAGGSGGGGAAVACGTVLVGRTYRCRGDLTVRASTFFGNNTGVGGAGGAGASAPALTADAPALTAAARAGGTGGTGGSGGNGGAIQFIGQSGETPSKLAFENSTFDGNSTGAGGKGGGAGGNGGRGTAVHANFDGNSTTALATLTHVTMIGGSGGAAGTAGATGEAGAAGGGTLVVEASPWVGKASIIGGGDGASCSSTAETPSFSKSTDASCGFGESNVHPFSAFALAPLASNGGPTETRLPGPGSVLLDTAGSWSLATDQRGLNRPQGSGFYIGSVEVSRSPAAPVNESTTGGDSACNSTGPWTGGGSSSSGGSSSGGAWAGGSGSSPGEGSGSGSDTGSNCSGGGAGAGGAWAGDAKDKDKGKDDKGKDDKDKDHKDKDHKDKGKDDKDKDHKDKGKDDKGKDDKGKDDKEISGQKDNPSPAPSAVQAAVSGGGETLSQTGYRVGPVAALGVLLIIAGVVLLVVSYRKPGRHRLAHVR